MKQYTSKSCISTENKELTLYLPTEIKYVISYVTNSSMKSIHNASYSFTLLYRTIKEVSTYKNEIIQTRRALAIRLTMRLTLAVSDHI